MSGTFRFSPGCKCCGTTPTMVGCGNKPLSNWDFDVYDHQGGALLHTYTSDSAGKITLTPGQWVLPHTGRFNGQSYGGGSQLTFTPASGYYCMPYVWACAYPLWHSLSYEDTFLGSTLVDNDGTGHGWTGVINVDYPGYALCGCPTSTFNAEISVGAFGDALRFHTVTWSFYANQPGFRNGCPSEDGSATYTWNYGFPIGVAYDVDCGDPYQGHAHVYMTPQCFGAIWDLYSGTEADIYITENSPPGPPSHSPVLRFARSTVPAPSATIMQPCCGGSQTVMEGIYGIQPTG